MSHSATPGWCFYPGAVAERYEYEHDPVVAMLRRNRREVVGSLHRNIVEQVAEYRGGLSPVLRRTLERLLDAFLDWDRPATSVLPEILESAENRAAEGVALDAILESWRIAKGSMWAWLVEASSQLESSESIVPLWSRFQELADAHSANIAALFSAYRADDRLAAGRSLSRLLDGDTPERTLVQLRKIGLATSTIAIVVCRDVDDAPSSDVGPGDYSRFFRAISDFGSHPPVTLHNDCLVTLVDPTAPTLGRVMRLAEYAGSLRIGISAGAPPDTPLNRLLEQARTALSYTNAVRPLCRFESLTLPQVVARRTSLSWTDLPVWLRNFLLADGQYVETARALIACDLRVRDAARRLNLHVNSVYHRQNLVRERFDVDLGSFDVLVSIELALNAIESGMLRDVPPEFERL